MSSFWLEFDLNGQQQNASFTSQSVTIGRDRGSDFILDHPTVSRQHALIVEEGGGSYRLVVLSRGGLTAVDGQPVSGEVTLWDGAMLTLGKHSVRFRAPDATAQPPRPSSGVQSPAASPAAPAGFGQAGGGASPAGFGQPAGGPAAGGFGQPAGGSAPGGFGQPAGGGFGQTPAGDSPSAFGQPAGGGGGFGAPPPSAAPKREEKPEPSNPAGIVSWDEIAASDEALSEAEDGGSASDFQRIQSASKKAGGGSGETNPAVVIGGVLIAVGMLAFTFLGGGDPGTGEVEEQVSFADMAPVQIEVECAGGPDCIRKAQDTYRIAIDLLEKKDVENRNLFDGYMRLLEARELAKQGGAEELPPELADWETMHATAREQLDGYYKNFRAAFHSAKQRDRYIEMATTLNQLEAFFPEPTSRENRWATEMKMEMKASGIYPRTMR